MVRKYCPILLIGFPPPKEGERDLRRCTKECALYNEAEDTCAINSCLESLNMLKESMENLPEFVYEMLAYEDDPFIDTTAQD